MRFYNVGDIKVIVKVIVAQVPVCGDKPPSVEPSRANFDTIKKAFLQGDIRASPETTTGPIPVVSFDQSSIPSLLNPIQAFRWFIEYGGRLGSQWVNMVTRVTPDTPMPFHPPAMCSLRHSIHPNDGGARRRDGERQLHSRQAGLPTHT